jgi:hypothetical protein
MATRSKVGNSSRRTSFRDQADLQDIFASSEDNSEDEELPSGPKKKLVRRSSNPSTSRLAMFTDTIRAAQTQVRTIKKQDIGFSNSLKRHHEKGYTTSESKGLPKSVETSSEAISSTTVGSSITPIISTSESQRQAKSIGNHNHKSSINAPSRDAQSDQKMVRPEVASSSVRKSSSTSTAVHILRSVSRAYKDRAITGGQTIRSKAVQGYGTDKSSTSITTKKNSVSIAQPAGPSGIPVSRPKAFYKDQRPISSHPTAPPPIMTTAPASQSQRPPVPTARLQLPTQSVTPSQPLTQAVPLSELPARRVTPPTSPTTRVLVEFIGPTVAAIRTSREARIIHEDTSLEDTSLESLEGPNIMTPHIVHVPVDSYVPRLESLSPYTKREESPELGSESSYYDRSLYGPSSPPCLPGADFAQLATGNQPMNGSPSVNGGHSLNGGQSSNGVPSVNGGPSNYGPRSVCEDLDPDALDDEEFELLVYGERIVGRDEAEGDELASEAEAMDICSDDEDLGATGSGTGTTNGDPVEQWRANIA